MFFNSEKMRLNFRHVLLPLKEYQNFEFWILNFNIEI